MKRVLVTGGAGFIGSHVAEAYLRRGWEVVVLDDLSSGTRENVPAGAELVHLDIRDPEAARVVREGGFDLLSHHAAQMDVRVSVRDPRYDASINVDGLLNLLEAAREAEVGRVLFASSGGMVYGDPEEVPVPEGAPKLAENPYGISKLVGEHYLFYYHRVHGMEHAVLRYGNVYGPRQDPHGEAGVVAIFSTRLLRDEPLTVFGGGEQTRDYVYVDDVVAAHLLLSELPLPAARTMDERAFNVGSGGGTSVNVLAERLMRAAGKRVELRHAPARPGETQRGGLDTTRLRGLGWEPRMEMEEGLRKTYEWVRDAGGANGRSERP